MVSNLNPNISASKSFDYIASIFSDIHLLSFSHQFTRVSLCPILLSNPVYIVK